MMSNAVANSRPTANTQRNYDANSDDSEGGNEDDEGAFKSYVVTNTHISSQIASHNSKAKPGMGMSTHDDISDSGTISQSSSVENMAALEQTFRRNHHPTVEVISYRPFASAPQDTSKSEPSLSTEHNSSNISTTTTTTTTTTTAITATTTAATTSTKDSDVEVAPSSTTSISSTNYDLPPSDISDDVSTPEKVAQETEEEVVQEIEEILWGTPMIVLKSMLHRSASDSDKIFINVLSHGKIEDGDEDVRVFPLGQSYKEVIFLNVYLSIYY
jgi:hypothetical protein